MKRKTAVFCLFFCVGCFAFALLFGRIHIAFALTASVIFPALLYLPFIRKIKLVTAISGALAAAIVCTAYWFAVLSPATELFEKEADFVAVAEDYCVAKTGYGIVDCRLLSKNVEKYALHIRVYLEDGSPEDIEPGDRLIFRGRANAISDRSRYSDSVFVSVSQTGEMTVEKRASDGIIAKIKRLSHRLSLRFSELFGEEKGAVMSAILCGNSDNVSEELKSALYGSGLSHALAVSGLHVTIIFSALAFILGKKAGFAISVPVIAFYVVLTGCSPSVLRAAIMCVCCILAFFLRSDYDRFTSLALAGAIICATSPFAAVSASFLLSFGATLGIILFAQKISVFLRFHSKNRAVAILADAASVTPAATVITLPVSLLFYGGVSLLSVPANIIAVWAIAPAMVCGILSLVPVISPVAVFAGKAFLSHFLGAARLFGEKVKLVARTDDVFLLIFVVSLLAFTALLFAKKLNAKQGAAVIACAFLLFFVSSRVFDSLVLRVEIVGDGRGNVCTAVLDGQNAELFNAPGGFKTEAFINKTARNGRITRIVLGTEAHSLGASAENCAEAEIISPENIANDGKIGHFRTFSCGENKAVLVCAGKLSILDVSCVSPLDCALPEIKCDVLTVSQKWAQNRKMLSVLCSKTKPSLVLISVNDYAERPDLSAVCGCKTAYLNDCELMRFYAKK